MLRECSNVATVPMHRDGARKQAKIPKSLNWLGIFYLFSIAFPRVTIASSEAQQRHSEEAFLHFPNLLSIREIFLALPKPNLTTATSISMSHIKENINYELSKLLVAIGIGDVLAVVSDRREIKL